MRLEEPPAEERNVGIVHILVPAEQGGDEGKGLVIGEPAGGRGHLRAHLGVGFDRGAGEEGVEDIRRQRISLGARRRQPEIALDAMGVAQQTHRPSPHRGVGMSECFLRGRVVESRDLVKRPERVERGGPVSAHGEFLQLRRNSLIAALPEETGRGAAMPFVGVIEKESS